MPTRSLSRRHPRQQRGDIRRGDTNDRYLLLHGDPFSGLSVLEDPRTLPDGRAEGGSPPNYFNKTRDMLESAWNEFVPFLEFPVELRKIVYPTNSIESLNARFRRAVRHRGHFPTEQAAMKVLYLVAIARQRIGRT